MDISFPDFSNATPDSLTWYDLLPGDAIRIHDIPDSRSVLALARCLLHDPAETAAPTMDLLTARLLNGEGEGIDLAEWPALTTRLSQWMSNNLTALGSRPLRMRAQRLHYSIQSLLDRAEDPEATHLVLHEETLIGNKPWDQLKHDGAQWWISSDELNIHRRTANAHVSDWRHGIPTQIDCLADGRLAFGTLYSNGAWLTDGTSWTLLAHDRPVVLVFSHARELLFLDHDGCLVRVHDRAPLLRVPCRQVHFARYFGGTLYCMDNGDFGHLTLCDLHTGRCTHQLTWPVMVCNDLTVTPSHLYLIDKQQGSVFKFDREWHYLRRALKFGKGTGRLIDPVSIRVAGDHLQVLSWLSARITYLKLF